MSAAARRFALVIDQRGTLLETGARGTLVVRHADGRVERVGLGALGAVVLHGDVALSTGVLRAMAEHDIAFAASPREGAIGVAGFVRWPRRQVRLRHQQHLVHADPVRRLAMARVVVQAKLAAIAAFVAREAWGCEAAVTRSMRAAHEARDLDTLRGVEGAATAAHFAVLRSAYGEHGPFAFDGRSRQPPRDAPNALMSLGYALAGAEAARVALRCGLDVQLGFLHEMHRDRESLALDLVEPARAVVDEWVLELLQRRRQLPSARFRATAEGGMVLTQEGRADFYPRWFSEGRPRALEAIRSLAAEVVTQLRRRVDRRESPRPW